MLMKRTIQEYSKVKHMAQLEICWRREWASEMGRKEPRKSVYSCSNRCAGGAMWGEVG